MRILFLDIDNVLHVNSAIRDEWGAIFHEHFVNNLRRIIDRTKCKIIISSSWKDSGLKELRRMWESRNLPGEILDVTPYSNTKYVKIATDTDYNTEETLNSPRGVEIYWSLKQHPCDSYVIIDDVNDMLYCQKDNFVHTANLNCEDAINGYGLTNLCAFNAIDILLNNNKSILL